MVAVSTFLPWHEPVIYLSSSYVQNLGICSLLGSFLFCKGNIHLYDFFYFSDVNVEYPDKRSVLTYVTALYKALHKETPVEKDTQRIYTSQLKVSLQQEGNPPIQSIQDVKKNRYSLTLSLDGVCTIRGKLMFG